MAKKRRRRSKGKSRKHHARRVRHTRRRVSGRRRKSGKRRAGKSASLIKAYWRKHRAAIMKHSPKKRFKFVWSQIKRGKC